MEGLRVGNNAAVGSQPPSASENPRIGIGLDSCVIPLSHGLFLIQTTDFFYPLVEDPFQMGRIACANVLSDLYAMGVMKVDNILMLLGISTKFTASERDIVVSLMIDGFRDCAAEAGTQVQGGQTVLNPWMTIGGVATAVCSRSEFIMPDRATVGDVLVLTKPLGTQVAVNAHQWMEMFNSGSGSDWWDKIAPVISFEEVREAYLHAMESMSRLNRVAARLMHKHGAHGATDVTGFGLLGHAGNLAECQQEEVSFLIHTLPIIAKMAEANRSSGNLFRLLEGKSAETSGGLLIALPADRAEAFCLEIEETEGWPAWIIGRVEAGERKARIADSPRILEVMRRAGEAGRPH